jgi:putative intracellular protease/amidase/Cu/Ag efflux protein CusF
MIKKHLLSFLAAVALTAIGPSLFGQLTYGGSAGDDHAAGLAPAGGETIYTEERPLVVGVLLFDDFEPLDVFGPIEIFGGLGKKVKIVMLAEKAGTSRPRFGPAVLVDRTLDQAGEIDLLLIPGGSGTRAEVKNASFLAALKRLAESTPHVATVCTGSGLLARTGLLAGHRATSNKRAFQWAVAQDRNVHWVHEARWIEDGKYTTSSGVSAGIDLSLGIVASLFGRAAAVTIAQNTEYVWNDDPTKDPFAALNAHTAQNDPTKKYPLHGLIVDVVPQRSALLVNHEEIPGIMAAMTMSFNIDGAVLATAHKGEAIGSVIYQLDGEWRLDDIKPADSHP